MTAHQPAAQVVRDVTPDRPPRIGIVLGSGLADIAGLIEQSIAIPYEDLPGFPTTTVEGHTGKLVIGDWAGTRVACMQGRFHVYEGHDPVDLALPIRALGECGCIQTNHHILGDRKRGNKHQFLVNHGDTMGQPIAWRCQVYDFTIDSDFTPGLCVIAG